MAKDFNCNKCYHGQVCAYKTAFKDTIRSCNEYIPTADVVEVKHGEWVRYPKIYGVGYEYVCSACEKGIRQYEGQPICSECGAKMDGGNSNG